MPNNDPHENLARYTLGEAQNAMIGQNGWEFVDDTSAHTTGYYCIQVTTDAVFTAYVGTGVDSTGISSFTMVAGTHIYGNCTSFTLASGTVIAYLSGVPA